MNLPTPFTEAIRNTFGERGRLFLSALPTLLEEAAQRWQLTDVRPSEQLFYNFIAYARRSQAEVVLKIGVPDPELTSEIRSLRYFAGRGMVRLLESDSARGMLLLERLRPGQQLAGLPDDAAAMRVAAQVMLAIRREPPSDAGLIQLTDWYQGFDRLRARFDGGTGPLDAALLEKAQRTAAELLAENHLPALIHGDLHHFNILSSERGWLAIDPKGVIGPAAYEVGPLLMNPWAVLGLPGDAAQLLRSRISILSESLALEKQRIRLWGLAYAVLSAIWSLEGAEDWRLAMECARMLAALDL